MLMIQKVPVELSPCIRAPSPGRQELGGGPEHQARQEEEPLRPGLRRVGQDLPHPYAPEERDDEDDGTIDPNNYEAQRQEAKCLAHLRQRVRQEDTLQQMGLRHSAQGLSCTKVPNERTEDAGFGSLQCTLDSLFTGYREQQRLAETVEKDLSEAKQVQTKQWPDMQYAKTKCSSASEPAECPQQ